MKAAVAIAGRITSDSLVSMRERGLMVADTRLKNARSELWVWRGFAALGLVLLFLK